MIFRRYGSRVHSVQPDFDARAMTEVGFRRDSERSMTAEEFETMYERLEVRELAARVDGTVQDEAERAMLDDLLGQVEGVRQGLEEGQVLLVENTTNDYPKTRDRKHTVQEPGGNRLHFEWWVDPPLRLGIYRSRS